MPRSIPTRVVVLVFISSLVFGVAPPACSLNTQGEHYEAGAQSSASAGSLSSTSSAGSTSAGTGGSTMSGSGGQGIGGAGEGGGGAGGSTGEGGGAGGMGGQGGGPVGICGDGVIDSKEECDDGGNADDTICVDCQVECPGGAFENDVTHHCYWIPGNNNWDVAKMSCTGGFYFATIQDQDEIDFLLPHLSYDTWVGGYLDVNGSWSWLNGDPWPSTPLWDVGQPNDTGDCVELSGESDELGGFNDEPWSAYQPYLCEWKPPGI